ncbi:tandem-95 repeat protein, partial [Pseudoalteromonas sp. C2R02]|uniref:Ig-like domain-containing protein n=1 Tax=Pseudoalteromonas sp. C2R02 TaxID=2841565 RepID=UPI001C091DAA
DGQTHEITVTVNGTADATETKADAASVNEDGSVVIDVLANDSDIDSEKSPVVSVTNGENGTVSINPDGTVTYTPDPDYNGTDTFTYTNAEGNTETVTVFVTPVDDETVIKDDIATVNEDGSVVIDVLANDTDADGSKSSVVSATNGTNGTVVINQDGTVTYTPNPDFNGTDTFTYTNAEGSTATVTVNVTPDGDATVIKDDTATVNEDGSVVIDVLANDTDADGSKSPVVSVTNGSNGTVVINQDGTVTYTPNPDFNGTDTFTYTNAEGSTATVTVNVTPDGDATVIKDDTATVNEDGSVIIDVLANDTDADGSKSPVVSVTNGSNGTVVINQDGTVTYTPNPDFNGTDTFTYTNAEGNTATVIVTVKAVNTDTVADVQEINEDEIATGNVLTNDEADNTEIKSFTVDIDGDGNAESFT